MPQEKLSIPSTFTGQHKSFLWVLASWHPINNHLHTLGIQMCAVPGVCILHLDWNRDGVLIRFILYTAIASFVSKKEIQLNSYSYKKQHNHFFKSNHTLWDSVYLSLLPLTPKFTTQTWQWTAFLLFKAASTEGKTIVQLSSKCTFKPCWKF